MEASKEGSGGGLDLRGHLASLGRDLGLVGASEVHYGVHNDIVVLEAVLGLFDFSLGKLTELAVDLQGRVVELVIIGDSGPSVEDGLEVVADAFAISVDLIGFAFIVDVLLEREGDHQQVDDQSFAVHIDVVSKVSREFLQETGFFRVNGFFDLPTAVVQGAGQDDDFVFVQHKDLAEGNEDIVQRVFSSQIFGD